MPISAQGPISAVVDPWIQQAELTASDGAAGDDFGKSVALSGSTIVVGVPQRTVGSNSTQGAAYVFVQSGSTWVQQAELTASDGAAFDEFGSSVAVSGSTAVIGAAWRTVGSNQYQGAVYVFVESGGTWSEQAELTASDGGSNNYFGFSVALSGSTIMVGAPGHPTTGSNVAQGAAYVFVQSGSTWVQQAELTASDGMAYDQLGSSVAVSGSTVVAGAPCHMVGSNTCQGAAYVFVESGGTWSQQAELTLSDSVLYDQFGWSVALIGATAVVGANNHTVGSNVGQGAAYVFVESGGTWSQQAELTVSDGAAYDHFGSSVGLSGSTVLVGAPQHPYFSSLNVPGPGAAYIFLESGGTWSQQAEPMASDGAANEGFGHSVAVDSGTGVVGAPTHPAIGPNADQGAAYVFGSSSLTGTATKLGLSPSTVVAGSSGPVVMTATVSPTSGSGMPTGTVTFYSASTQIGTGTVSGGVATYSYNPGSLAVGAYSITATYGGDSNFSASSSSPETLAVTSAPTFTVSVNPTSLTIKAGQSGQAVFTVTPENGFNSKVSFSCSGLPAESSCKFNPISVTPSNGQAATSTLIISTTAPSAAMRRAAISTLRPFYALLLFPGVMVSLGRPSRQRRASRGLQLLALLVLIAVFGNGVSSCGGGGGGSGAGNPGTPTGTSTVIVTASTGGTGAVTQTANLTVKVNQ